MGGDDRLTGGIGNDTLDGGDGADTAIFSGNYADYQITEGIGELTIVGPDGTDTLRNINKLQFDGQTIDLVTPGVYLVGTEGSDTLVGDAGDDYISGLGGDDSLFGNSGDDTIAGDAGNDFLDGGDGNDTLDGGTDDDTYVVRNLGQIVREIAGAGNADKVLAAIDDYHLANEVEDLDLGNGVSRGNGNDKANKIRGNEGSNNIDGGQGADRMEGGRGADTYIVDDAGDDVFEADNTLTGTSGFRLALDLGSNIDKVIASISYTLGNYLENLELAGSGNLSGIGNTLDNVLTGNAGNNTLAGAGGNDVFVFAASGNGTDTITDFSAGDSITVTGATFSGAVAAGNGSAVLANQIQLAAAGGVTTLYIGTDSTAGADVQIQLTGTFSAGDFSLNNNQILINSAPTGGVTITGTATQGQTLSAANTLADADGMGTVSYQWQADGTNISGATNSTYVLTETQVDKVITVSASYTDGHNTAESVTSSATAAVANINDAPTGGVTITGTAEQGQTLTAANTLADIDGMGTVSYQWKADGTNITGATGSTYVLAESQVGKIITVAASYTDLHNTAESVTSSATGAVANINDIPTGGVTITGTATQGQALTASNTLADIDGLGTISYQWQADGTNITGATGSNYVLAEAQVGKTITVFASYTDVHSTAESVTSSATGAVANINDIPTGGVTITGTAEQGQTLSAANTLADIDGMGTVGYQWKADGTDISGAINSTYVLAEAQVGKIITASASYTDGHNTAESVTSSATAAVANVNDAPTGSVTISGTATQGQTLTAANTLADIDGLGTISYQWQADGANITGATASTYVLTEAQVGKTITASASYTDGHNTAESVTSSATAAVANVNDAPTGSVTITGTATQGQTLSAANTLADIDGLGTISYQWKADGTNISGATGSTYVLAEAQVGKIITVAASYTDGHNTAESVTSTATTAVANVNDVPTGSVTITGTATQGHALTASNTLVDTDGLGTIAYQWEADGIDISGATNNTLVLAEAQVGKVITVTASYTDGHGTAESVASTSTMAVWGYQIGSGANDKLVGTAYSDILEGGDGNDLLNGGKGADTMSGGSGNDLYFVDHRDDQVIELANDTGIDMVIAKVDYTLPDNVENLMLNASVTLRGPRFFFSPRKITIDLGVDGIGNDQDNILYGNRGNNDLAGNAGSDTLFAGSGADNLTGGIGADRLWGGAGADTFIFAAGNGGISLGMADVIFDFKDGADRIGLAGGLGFAELSITQGNGSDTLSTNTVMATQSGEYLAVLVNLQSSQLTANDFVMIV